MLSFRAKQGEVEEPRGPSKGFATGCLDFARHDGVHFSSSSFALIFSKFGNWRASSLLSAYWIIPVLSMMNAERFGTPPIPRFICGRNESYITPYSFATLWS